MMLNVISLLIWVVVIFSLIYNSFEIRFLTDNVARAIGLGSTALILGQLIWSFIKFIKGLRAKNILSALGHLTMVILLVLMCRGILWVTMIYFGLGTYTDG
jgi:hypothetical protein